MKRAPADPTDVPACLACGACCFSDRPDHIRVFGGDLERIGADGPAATSTLDGSTYMRMEDGHCVALQTDPVSATHRCALYHVRPDVCRGLEPGSSICRSEIAEKGDRPHVALEALRRTSRR